MKKFLVNFFKFSSVFLVPLIILLSLYIYMDPFKAVFHYETYFEPVNPPNVELNKDVVSTYTFINNSKKISYNSFIFGNSRSIFYEINDWKKFIKNETGCFHFDASGEALFAMHKKILFLKNRGIKIKNCLIIMDYATLKQIEPKKGHLSVISPVLVGNSNLIEFHKTFFEAFVTPQFFIALMDFKKSGIVKPYMLKEHFLDNRTFLYDYKTNQMHFQEFEEMIESGKYYTPERKKVFYARPEKERVSEKIISEKQKEMLIEMSLTLKEMKANVKMVINPLYDQIKLNQADLNYLEKLFGKKNVYDFSGKNKITENYKNYYEASHYRPHVAKSIMEEVYSTEMENN